jgi:hypothetical protein
LQQVGRGKKWDGWPSGRGGSQGERRGDGGSHGECCGDGGLCLMGVGAELETTSKNQSENEQENGHFRNSDGMVRFLKNDHFSSDFVLIFKFIF